MIKPYIVALALYRDIFKLLGSNKEWLHYDQTFRAAGSIVANIAEGEGSRRGKEGNTATRWSTARGSLFEVVAWLDIALVEAVLCPKEVRGIKGRLDKLAITLNKEIERIDSAMYLDEDDAEERARKETERIQGYLRP